MLALLTRLCALWPELTSALAALTAAGYVAADGLREGFPLDDAWIHMVYGLGIVRGGSLSYNDGVPATGCTSPLWAVVAALSHILVGARGPSMAAVLVLKAFGVAAHVTTATLSSRLVRISAPRDALGSLAAVTAGVAVATCPVLAYAAASGMEVGLTSALIVGSIVTAVQGTGLTTGACVAFAFLARPEALIVALPTFALLAVGASLRKAALRVASAGSVVLVAGVALVGRNQLVSGHPLPATFYVKAHPVHDPIVAQIRLEAGWDLVRALVPVNPRVFSTAVLVAVLSPVLVAARAVVARARKRRPPQAWASGSLPGAIAALSGAGYAIVVALVLRIELPQHFYFQRYFAPSLPPLLIAATLGILSALLWVGGAVGRLPAVPARWIVPVCVATLGVWVAWRQSARLADWRARYVSDVGAIDAVQVAIGHYVASELAPDAVVWSMDAGAPKYWGQRRTVDLGRLNTPQLFEANEIRPGWDASAIVVLDGPMRLVAPDGLLEFARGFGSSGLSQAGAPPFTQVAWRCHGAGLGAAERHVAIEGYPSPLGGRCAGP
jgi:hypothetical protein